MNTMTMRGAITAPLAASVLQDFDVRGGAMRPDIRLPGSPERCVARVVVQDENDELWVLERLFGGQRERRTAVARLQSALAAAGLSSVPAFRAVGAEFHVRRQEADWQLAPFVPGDLLPRPGFVEDEERGTNLADFLAAMRRAGPVPTAPLAPSDGLPDYVNELLDTIRGTRPELLPALTPLHQTVTPLFEAWNEVPRGVCHGDFHPLNVIWRGQDVAAVIDWEFAGVGPDLYDAANMLGCVGMEEPRALLYGLSRSFVLALREGGVLRADNERFLRPLVVAVRFAWLSEWLRKGDEEMLDTELAYMRLVANSAQALGKAWGMEAV